MKKLISILIMICMACTLFSITALAEAPSNNAESAGGPGGGPGGPGGPEGSGNEGATDTSIITLIPEKTDELIIGPEGYEFTTDMYIGKLEIDPTAMITSKYPVIVFFDESDSVENGTVIDNVQFISDYDEVIAIVHTNDVHGHLEVEPYVKGFADELKDSGDYSLVLTVSAGDIYGGRIIQWGIHPRDHR